MDIWVAVLIVAVHVVSKLIVLGRLLVVGVRVVRSGMDGMMRDNRGSMDSMMRDNGGSMDSMMRDNGGSVDSMMRDNGGGMDSMMRDNGGSVDSVMANYWGGMYCVVGDWSWMVRTKSHGRSVMRSVMAGGDNNSAVADGGVVGDVPQDSRHEGAQGG